MIKCVKCGRENEDHYKFCLGCGSNLEEQRAAAAPAPAAPSGCPQCSAPITPGQRFCGSCGFNLADYQPPAAAPPAAAPPAAAPPAAAPPMAAPPAAAPPVAPAPTPTASGGASAPATAGSSVGSAGALIMINPDGSPGDMVPLNHGSNSVGRGHSAHVLQRDPFLNQHHATFNVQGSQIEVIDNNSVNGVFYRITEPTELQHGDYVRVGQELLRYEALDQVEPLMTAPTDGTVLSGSNPSGAWGRLARISAPNEASFIFMLRGNEQVLGRERGDILFRDDGYVSGKHARVYRNGDKTYIEDLKSSNGTFVRIRGQRTLPNGSLILMGKQPFRIQLSA